MMTPGGDYVDDDGFFTCAVSVQHKVASKQPLENVEIVNAQKLSNISSTT